MGLRAMRKSKMRWTGASVSMSCEKSVRIHDSAKNGSVGTGEILSVSSLET